MPGTYADTQHTRLQQMLKALGAKMPALCDLYDFNHLKMWPGQYALCTKGTGSFSFPLRLGSLPFVVPVTLPDTMSEYLRATHVAPSWGNSRTVESGPPALFCGKLLKLKLCPQRLPFQRSKWKVQYMCNKTRPFGT